MGVFRTSEVDLIPNTHKYFTEFNTYLKDLGVDGRIILKWVQKIGMRSFIDSSGL